MVFNLERLDIKLDFERRKYRLGDTINVTVTLIPNSDVEIRTASLSLMGQVRRTEVRMGIPMSMDGSAKLQGGNSFTTTDYIPMQQHTDQKMSTEVFDSAQIVLNVSLQRDVESRHNVALRLDPRARKLQNLAQEAKGLQRDANSSLSIEPWWLEVHADVAMGRDARVRRQIEIVAPLKTSA
ncbi:MAG: hypothetical protein OXI33_09505 [Chloroflexota bacterium]|nr:hypothetical protein [Chloroflexota bacterium]